MIKNHMHINNITTKLLARAVLILFLPYHLFVLSARLYVESVGPDVQKSCYIPVLDKHMVVRQYACAAKNDTIG